MTAQHGMTRLDRFMKECLDDHATNASTPLPQVFGYLLGHSNPVTGSLSDKVILRAFDALVDTMATKRVTDGPAEAGMTFFGQFIDHDITLDATSEIGTEIDPRSIRNVRTPNLDLDCVYGDGPEASPHLYSPEHTGYLLFGRKSNPLDLARNDQGTALIGDPRNDENIIVSQVQGAFICLHNILMDQARKDPEVRKVIKGCAAHGMRSDLWTQQIIEPSLELFEEVRRFIRLHYQWLVLNDFLPAFVEAAPLKDALNKDPFGDDGPIMPAEFSVAAYRFGHATVQPKYRLCAGAKPVDLFKMQGFQPRKKNATIEFSQFFDTGGGSAQRALPVGIRMAETLFSLPFIKGTLHFRSVETTEAQAKKLALRNILRDRGALLIASGQQVARHLGKTEQHVPRLLERKGIDKTPLWYYCLQEAQPTGRLNDVGAAIVGSVFGRLLRHDPESVWHIRHTFAPWQEFGGAHCSMGSLMAFVEKHRDSVSVAKDLRSG